MKHDATSRSMSEEDIENLVIESDTGARKPRGLAALFLIITALTWSLFQLWIASPLPYTPFFSGTLGIHVFNSTEARYFHLAFGFIMCFMAYPALRSSPRRWIPLTDWLFLIAAVISTLYLFVFKDALAYRTGLPTTWDLAMSAVGIICLLEAARRALGPPLVTIAIIFLLYTFFGNQSFIPDIIAHKGQSLSKVSSHQWLSTEGVFGIALGVSTDFVFMFVLFGALLDKAGAGNYFIKLAFSMMGHLRGGPAKAAVVASAMTGLISGSSIANVVTTGTFTIPLMRKVGFSREKAGAVEVASSVNGQIMPPVMGAAAFLMAEYVGISYLEVVKAAFIPAIISYIALFYMLHLEAAKANLPVLSRALNKTVTKSLYDAAITISSVIILAGLVYYGLGWIKTTFEYSLEIAVSGVILTYLGLLYRASMFEDLQIDSPDSKVVSLPQTAQTARTGFHYILPIIVLIWCLMVERLSPGLSAFWATAFMILILATQRPLKSLFRRKRTIKADIKISLIELLDGLTVGARNMTAIAIATAAAGIVVGSVSLTGVGQVMTELVEVLSGGSFFLVLIFTAFICLILGMGLPTTANYIVVSSLMAQVIAQLAEQNGVVVPLIAIHLFVFYFGIMADVTPPVGLASFAAAAVSGGDPIRTGLQAFFYSLRTVILPFIFIYNTDMLLIGVTSFWHGMAIFMIATISMLAFAAATQRYLIMQTKTYETIMLLLVAFTLLRPGFWVDIIQDPYLTLPATSFNSAIEEAAPGDVLKLDLHGQDHDGKLKDFVAFMTISDGKTSQERIDDYGIATSISDKGHVVIDDVFFNSAAEKAGVDFDFTVKSIEVPQEQFNRYWMYLVAFIMLGFVIVSQQRRRATFMVSEISKGF